MSDDIRVQIIADAALIAALKAAETTPDVELSDHALPESDQNFGLVEAAAVVAFATSVAKLAELLVKVYRDLNDDAIEVTVKTAQSTVTVKGAKARNVQQLIGELTDMP
ncbi:MAG: hypothetical protein WBA67_06090 [Jannaschia sp.]